MRLKHEIRHVIQRFGIDVVRYPLHDPLARTVKLMQNHRIDCVVDVGANDGGFAVGIRRLGYTGRIISFEPLQAPYQALSRKAADDPLWSTHQNALGSSEGEVTINVSNDAGLSSSVLPMLRSHTEAAPDSHHVRTETVAQARLDRLLPTLGLSSADRIFLKVDVEGYERHVLDGASGLFNDGGIVGLQLELSLIPLYGGAMTYREGLDYGESLGMTLMGIDPVFANPQTGQLLQADAVFFAQ